MPGWAVGPCTYHGDGALWHVTAIDLLPRGRHAKREATPRPVRRRSPRPGPGFVVIGAVLGGVASLVAGLLVAAVLNSWLAIDWLRGIPTMAAGVDIAASLPRIVIQVARARLRNLEENTGTDR
jgi:hypothetical protein